MNELAGLPLIPALAVFVVATLVITVVGRAIAAMADRLADLTGWGEAFFGAVLLGSSTSLPGIVTSVTAAADGHPELAFSNAVGGIAAQTFFLAIADMVYRRANLEHAAASVANMMQAALLVVLLSLVILFIAAPPLAVGGVHPGSLVLVLAYVFGLRLIGGARTTSTWRAVRTSETVIDRPTRPGRSRTDRFLWTKFLAAAAALSVAGFVVAQTGIALSKATGLSETAVGALFTAIATSMPELVTSIAAVRVGALTLAVGNIIGGNSFDVLFVAFADFAYRPGSIYAAQGHAQIFVIALCISLTSILLLGLLRRERHGIANIGFESFLILVLYVVGVAALLSMNR